MKGITTETSAIIYSDLFDSDGNLAITIDVDSYRILSVIVPFFPRRLNYQLYSMVKGMNVYQNNHAYWLMEDTMRKLIPAGIPQYLRRFVLSFFVRETKNHEFKIPKVFSLKDLEFGFVTWLITCFIAIFVFLIEMIWYYGRSFFGIFAIINFFKGFPGTRNI